MGSFTFIQALMIVISLLLLVSGVSLLCVGIWTSVDSMPFLSVLGPFSKQQAQFVNVSYLCVSLGGALLLLSLLGCRGVHVDSKCLLISFFSIVMVIFVAEVAAAGVVLAYSSFAKGILTSWAVGSLQKYGGDASVTKMWDSSMHELKCCGFSNYTDFLRSSFVKDNGGRLPPYCCGTSVAPCSPAEAESSGVQGCFQLILEVLKRHIHILGGVATAIGVLEISAMSVSMYLYCVLDQKDS